MEIKRAEVEALIQQGQKKGLTGKDVIDALVRKGHKPEGVNVEAIKATFPQPVAPVEKTPSFGSQVATDVKNAFTGSIDQGVEGYEQIQNAQGNFKETMKGVGKLGSGVVGALFSPLAPVTKPIGEAVEDVSDKISDIPVVQEFAVTDTGQKVANTAEDIANYSNLVGGIAGVKSGPQIASKARSLKVTARDITNRILPKDPPPSPPVATLSKIVGDKVKTTVNDTPISIMNRVARLNPTEANKFKELSGMSHGEYLTKTGNFGTPEQIITVEAKKFIDSINQVDTAMESLPGVYKTQPLQSMANALVTRAKEVSTPGAPSPYLTQALELQRKLTGDGLSMKETNSLKRLFEQNVKLGYKLEQNPKMVEQATNIDTAVRKWQAAEAEKLGFENLPELNKQTQIAKFMIDELGAKMTGQTGLNAVTITDWIMLSGGNPAAIGGLLVKKVFSSKAVQAKIAKMLSEGESIPAIQAKLGITPANIERQVSPTGAKQLPAPAEGAPQSQNFVPIESRGKSTIEPMAGEVKKSSYNPKTGTQYVKDTKTGKTEYINKPKKVTPSKPAKPRQPKTK